MVCGFTVVVVLQRDGFWPRWGSDRAASDAPTGGVGVKIACRQAPTGKGWAFAVGCLLSL